MKYGITLPPFGPYADPGFLAAQARLAEEVGWDGFFIWDHIMSSRAGYAVADPWVALAAVACETSSIRLGAMITAIARRRPWKLARETVSLDVLSKGRLIIGVGLGEPADIEFGAFGEEMNMAIRAGKLDEGLAVLMQLWEGEPVDYDGEYYKLNDVVFRPRPVQQPRIPIWVAGGWPNKKPMRRAAKYDGVFPLSGGGQMTPADFASALAYVESQRGSLVDYDAVAAGLTPANDLAAGAEIVAPYAEAGATWWFETVDPWTESLDWTLPFDDQAVEMMTERIAAGPPRM